MSAMFSLVSFAVAVVLPLALASPVARAAHGQLESPTSGSTYYTARGEYHLLYKRAPQTVDVTVWINALNDTYFGVPFAVLAGLQSCNSGQDEYIDAHILLPNGFCGDYQFQVTEHQSNGQSFVSASPTVHVICPPPVLPPSKREMEERSLLPALILPYNNQPFTNNNGLGSSIQLLLAGDGQGDKGIDTTIEGNEQLYHLSLGLASTPCTVPGLPIYQAFFSPPVGACGTYAFGVYVDEQNNYPGVSNNIQLNCPA